MDKKYELDDQMLDMISGGKVLETTYELLDRMVKEAGENGYPKTAVRTMLKCAYAAFPEKFSDNGSFKDLNEILKYFDSKWKELYSE